MTVTRQVRVDLLVPCADFGELYVGQTDTGRRAIGCADALALGTLPDRIYQELPELGTPKYRVFRSLGMPGTYLMLPLHYRVGRHPTQVDATGARPPLISWLQEFDATHDVEVPCVLAATLAPDLLPADLTALTEALAARHAAPRVLLPTTPGSGLAGLHDEWALNTARLPAVVLDGDLVRVVPRLPYDEAALVQAQLVAGAQPAVGTATFELSDHSTLGPITLHLAVDELAGPWPSGPLDTALTGGSVTLTDRAGAVATVTALRRTAADGTVSRATDGLPVTLAPGAAATLAVPAGTSAVEPEYSLGAAEPAVIEAHRIYLDDLHTVAVVVNDLAMTAAGITCVDVTARLGSDPGSTSFTIPPELPRYELDIVEPLVADRRADAAVLTLRATSHRADGTSAPGPEVPVDLHQGALIALSQLVTR